MRIERFKLELSVAEPVAELSRCVLFLSSSVMLVPLDIVPRSRFIVEPVSPVEPGVVILALSEALPLVPDPVVEFVEGVEPE